MTDHTEMQIPNLWDDDVTNAMIIPSSDPDKATLFYTQPNEVHMQIRAAIARAILAERERCAKIAENLYPMSDYGDEAKKKARFNIASIIRNE